PALARALAPAEDRVERDEDVLTRGRAVLEREPPRIVASSDLDARQVGGDEGAGDPELLLAAEQAVGIAQAEGEADQRRHGRERDVALAPGEPDAEHLLALPASAADDALALRRGGVAAGLGPRQGEAGDLLA